MSKWLNTEKIINGVNDLPVLPCKNLDYCPYGQLVEAYPLKGGLLACPMYGHNCPAHYLAEFF